MIEETTPLMRDDLNRIIGRVEVGQETKDDVKKLVSHILALEELLDEGDNDDAFGTEGWRRRLNIED